MSKPINIAFCQTDSSEARAIESNIAAQGYSPKCYKFDLVGNLISELRLLDCDLIFLGDDSSSIDENLIAAIKQAAGKSAIIFLSGTADEIETAKFIRSGADLVINPADTHRVSSLASKLLTNKANELQDAASETAGGKLAEAELVLKTLLENIPQLVYLKDAKTFKYIYFNKASEDSLGLRSGEAEGKYTSDIFGLNVAAIFDERDRNFIESGNDLEADEDVVTTYDGKSKRFVTKKILVRDSSSVPKYFLGISEDITEQHNVREKLSKSEQRFSKIFQSAPASIFIISNTTRTVVDINDRFVGYIGVAREDIVGKKLSDFGRLLDKTTVALIEQVITERSRVVNQEISVTIGNNPEMHILVSVEQVDYADDSWSVFMGQDVTARKKVEAELVLALEKQKELNVLKTQFISMISHEFRTPLTTIMLSTDLLSRYSDQWLPAERDKYFIRIKDTVLKMTQLMENVLIVGRLDSGQFVYSPEEIDLAAMCFSIAKSVEFNFHNSHEIAVHFSGNCSKAMVDEKLLALIINNLLTNAVKYSTGAGKVDFFVSCDGQFAEIIVQDYGIGIPEKDLQHTFQSFFRASNVGPIPGYGLGLSIVQKCVESHLGKIELKSKLGIGTSFIVTLPIGGK